MKAFLGLLALPLLAQQGVNGYSPEKERALGAAFAQEVRRQGIPFENAEVTGYVQRVGERLAAQLPGGAPSFKFEVIQIDSASEPIPFPGGIVLVPVSSLLTTRSEPEFAGLMAHAMAHVALRHGTRTAARGQAASFATIPLVFLAGWPGLHADPRGTCKQIPWGFLEAQRAQETEADQFGLDLMKRAGYDPAAYGEYLRRSGAAAPIAVGNDEFARAQEAVRALVRPVQRAAPTLRR